MKIKILSYYRKAVKFYIEYNKIDYESMVFILQKDIKLVNSSSDNSSKDKERFISILDFESFYD